jgi:Uma2 family endonuclease
MLKELQSESTGTAKDDPPRLEAGDHLDQPTFHRLYEAMPPGFRAELIEGVVIVPSPLRNDHADIHGLVMGWLFNYRLGTPGVRPLDNASLKLPPLDEPQPDALLVIDPEYGGQTTIERGYRTGAPELIVEVAASSASYDLHSKFERYQKIGVQEYLVVVLRDAEARWFVARGGVFQPLLASQGGVFRSSVFPGLWLDAHALFADDATALVATLNQGLASRAHASFVKKLKTRRGKKG